METEASVDIRFEPHKTVDLPAQYAHFDKLGDYVKDLKEIDDPRMFYDDMYNASWNVLCMQIDALTQKDLIANLRSKQEGLGKDERSGEVSEYWKDLEETSIYPIYQKVKERHTEARTAQKTVQGWNKDAYREYHWLSLLNAASSIYPHIYDQKLASKAFGENIMKGGRNTLYFNDQLQALDENNEYIGYVSAVKLLDAARSISNDSLMSRIQQFEKSNNGEITTKLQDRELFIDVLYQRIEPYHLVAEKLGVILDNQEEAMFGDNAEIAGTLWRAAIFLRGSTLPSGTSTMGVREPLLKSLIDRDYTQARYLIEDLIAKYPDILPEYVVENLNLEPDTLRDLYTEQQQHDEAIRALEPKQLTPSQLEKEKIKQEKELANQIIRDQYLDRDLTTPDGSISLRIRKTPGGYSITEFTKVLLESGSDKTPVNNWKAKDLLSIIDVLQLSPNGLNEGN